MESFVTITGYAAPLPISNINTDMITPKYVMKAVTRKGLSWGLFREYRFHPDGSENPDFVLNREPWRHAKIIVALENFGCGSSREHSPWALLDFGIRGIVAVSFADIFYNNCFKNGILPVALEPGEVTRVLRDAQAGEEITIDLPTQTVRLSDGTAFSFEVNPFRKHALLNGLDDIAITLRHEAEVSAFEASQRRRTPWLFDRPPLQPARSRP